MSQTAEEFPYFEVDTPSGNCYAAVIENRAKEIGVAVLDISRLVLHVTQFIEAGRSYTTTQLLLDASQPRQLVIVGSTHHEVAGTASVNQVLAQAWDQVPLARSAFDDTKGILAVQELTGWKEQDGHSLQDGAPAAAGRALQKSHYLGFGAAGALLHHVRCNLGIVLGPRTLQVEFDGIKHHMSMDRDVIISLGILQPTKSRSALQKALIGNINSSTAAVLQKQKQLQEGGMGLSGLTDVPRGHISQPTGPSSSMLSDDAEEQPRLWRRGRRGRAQQGMPIIDYRTNSLFGFLNHTSTAAGARLLRTNLLQPLTDITTLELRLDSLQELLESPHLTLELTSLMETLPKNLDKVCSNLAIQPQSATSTKDPSTRLGRLVSSIILLRDVLRCLPVMADSMAWVDSDLLKAIKGNLGHDGLKGLLQDIEAVLDDDAQASKTQFVNKVQQCFAVRAEVDSFLDLSRASFTRLTESIHELAAQYRTSTGLSTLKVQYSSTKGFFLVVPEPKSSAAASSFRQAGVRSKQSDDSSPFQLPKTFLVLEKRGRNSICVTTHELNALNSRLRDAAADCMLLTVQVLEKLTGQLLQHMQLLQRMSDNIALLDLLLSFFHSVTGSDGDFCRPILSTSGPLAITKGRHPLLQAIKDPSFVCKPNDTYISPSCMLHLLTGPNMSGKSTYLKQVALLVVMAQIGCYVPATFMALSPYESLHTRIGTCDSIESNASSFMVEMADMAHLLARAGAKSLVLIDELGRATSTADGVALSWSMSEYLLSLGAHVLLATHFRQLEELAAIYPSCKLWRMQVSINNSDIQYSWTIAPAAQAAANSGEADVSNCHYGILLSQMAGLPAAITNRALHVAQQLERKQQQRQQLQQKQQGGSTTSLRQVYSLVHKLGCVARQAATDGAEAAAAADSQAANAAGQMRCSATAVQRVLPLLKSLKQEAEALLLAATKHGAL